MNTLEAPRKPPWVLPAARSLGGGGEVRRLLRDLGLGTVCESARCPNRGECFGAGTATFLILGGACTRGCGFCAVPRGAPSAPDPGEPARVAEAARRLDLRHAVVTSVTRDDLPDGGAAVFAATIRALRGTGTVNPSPSRGEGRVRVETGTVNPSPSRGEGGVKVETGTVNPSPSRGEGRVRVAREIPTEVLVPDFAAAPAALETVLAAGPAVLAHNVETVPRLYPRVRPGADYARSLALLRRAREIAPAAVVKSGLMAGLGEERGELAAVMGDLAAAGCASLTIGQYLQPARASLPVARYLRPEEFDELAAAGRAAGIPQVIAGPLVRSSYRAHEAYAALARGGGAP